MSNPSEVQPQTSGNTAPIARTSDSPEEAKRLQARSDAYPIFTTAYVEIERRSRALEEMRGAPSLQNSSNASAAQWARDDVSAFTHVRAEERSVALDAIGRSVTANAAYAASLQREAPELNTEIQQAKLSQTMTPSTIALASRMQTADWWYAYNDDSKKREMGAVEVAKIEKDLERLAGQNKVAAAALWRDFAPKAYQMPTYLLGADEAEVRRLQSRGEPQRSIDATELRQAARSNSIDASAAGSPAASTAAREVSASPTQQPSTEVKSLTAQADIDPDRLAKLQQVRQADTRSAALEMGLNSIEAIPARQVAPDTPEVASARSAAKAQIDPTDAQAGDRSKAIDAMQPSELAALTLASDRKQADAVYEQARNRVERASAEVEPRKVVPALEDRFNITRHLLSKDFEFRDRPGKVAFTERLNTLRTSEQGPSVAIGMIDRALERGWSAVRVSGTAEFQRQAWIAAEARGVKAVGYEPTRGDREAAVAERQRLEKERAARERQGRPAQRAEQAEASRDSGPSLGGRVVATAAVMRAFDLVMDKQRVPPDQQVTLRAELTSQLDAMLSSGKTPFVKVYDERAPRQAEMSTATPAPRREASERVR